MPKPDPLHGSGSLPQCVPVTASPTVRMSLRWCTPLVHGLPDQPARSARFAEQSDREPVPVPGPGVGRLIAEARRGHGEFIKDSAHSQLVVPEAGGT